MSGDILLIVAILVAVALVMLLLALFLVWRRPRPAPVPTPPPPPAPTPPPPPTPTPAPTPAPTPTPGPAHTIPDTLSSATLTSALAPRLAGSPADGSAPVAAAGTPAKVIWVDGGDEVLAHLDSAQARIVGATIVISIDLETDQTGRSPLITPFAVSNDAQGGLVAVTDEFPRGNGLLAARWGAATQAAAWSALLALASDHAAERGLAPRGLVITGGQLHLVAGEALRVK